jgi:sulfite reductase (NADPH) hemoprotein beta-component
MLRIAVPYGLLSSTQLRTLAHIGRKYDRGYGHFTTRQNIQFNWPRLEDASDILAELARVEMHAIQTSGNCIRNITCDHFAGVAGDEIVDPRPYCELFRQWSTFHPESAYLPRKFKIAVSGSTIDRAATLVHDIGVHAVRNEAGEVGFRVLVGGGLGRTPIVGHVIREFVPREEVLNYFDAIMRVYNRFGRRDNIYKARIKILVKEMTLDVFREHVETEWERIKGGPATVTDAEIARLSSFFDAPAYEALPGDDAGFRSAIADNRAFGNWVKRNVFPHKVPGYAAVTL